MTDAKKASTSPDALAKASKKAGVALTEEQLKDVSGGALNTLKVDGALKIDSLKISGFGTNLHK